MWTLTGIRGWGCRPGHLLVQVLTIGYGCGRRGSTDVDADRDPRVGPLAQEKGEELSPEAFYYCVGMMDIMSGLLYLGSTFFNVELSIKTPYQAVLSLEKSRNPPTDSRPKTL
eukprot:728142-Prorocentrum_minimum.AAC.1